MFNKNIILVTGAAGFIGFHICERLIKNGQKVIGLDNMNSYYDLKLKNDRLKELNKSSKDFKNQWFFEKGDLEDDIFLKNIFNKHNPNIVIHLAAQAGVRFSINHPEEYINSNLIGFFNVIYNNQ